MKHSFLLLFLFIFISNSFSQNVAQAEKRALKCLNKKISLSNHSAKNINELLATIKEYNLASKQRNYSTLQTKSIEISDLLNQATIFENDLLNVELLLECISGNEFEKTADENGYLVIYELVSFFEELIRRPSFRYEVSPEIWKKSLNELFYNNRETSDFNIVMYHILQTGFNNERARFLAYKKATENENTVSLAPSSSFADTEIETDEVVEFIEETPVQKEEIEYYTIVEEMPKSSLSETAYKAYFTQKNETKGKVYIRFAVMKDGSIKIIGILRGINKELNNIAIDLIRNMPKWKSAGKQRGVAVNVAFNQAIIFK